jgi:hypothetical protein
MCGSASRSTNVKTEIKKEIFKSLKVKNTIEESKEKKSKSHANHPARIAPTHPTQHQNISATTIDCAATETETRSTTPSSTLSFPAITFFLATNRGVLQYSLRIASTVHSVRIGSQIESNNAILFSLIPAITAKD